MRSPIPRKLVPAPSRLAVGFNSGIRPLTGLAHSAIQCPCVSCSEEALSKAGRTSPLLPSSALLSIAIKPRLDPLMVGVLFVHTRVQGIWDSRQGVELRLGVFLLTCLGRDANEKWRGVLQSCRSPCLGLRASIPTFCASNCPCSFFSLFHDAVIFEDATRVCSNLDARLDDMTGRLHMSTVCLISTCK